MTCRAKTSLLEGYALLRDLADRLLQKKYSQEFSSEYFGEVLAEELLALSPSQREHVTLSLQYCEEKLQQYEDLERTCRIRSHIPGDMGYVTYQHARFYSRNYGFDITFDSYVGDAISAFIKNQDPEKEHLWIAESRETILGSIAIVKDREDTAQLRWFLLEPRARGKGIGKRLLQEALDFSADRGYRKVMLWTVSNLEAARNLYARYGFSPVETKTHRIWGQELTEERWERSLP
ncbi:MAG TPA: GNAT family N-acetyltransferase [Synergistaceae bacterium]|nr:GNAT family N-acetyltransferase [Synergistaceae bacterium]